MANGWPWSCHEQPTGHEIRVTVDAVTPDGSGDQGMHRVDDEVVDDRKDGVGHYREFVLRHEVLQLRQIRTHERPVERAQSCCHIIRVDGSICHGDAGLD